MDFRASKTSGSLVHSEIEKYYTNGENGFTAELQNFIDQQQNNFKVLENEFTVTDNENFATNIELDFGMVYDYITSG